MSDKKYIKYVLSGVNIPVLCIGILMFIHCALTNTSYEKYELMSAFILTLAGFDATFWGQVLVGHDANSLEWQTGPQDDDFYYYRQSAYKAGYGVIQLLVFVTVGLLANNVILQVSCAILAWWGFGHDKIGRLSLLQPLGLDTKADRTTPQPWKRKTPWGLFAHFVLKRDLTKLESWIQGFVLIAVSYILLFIF